jgi:c-di-GMP-binding flagellar brake protein YcgR
MNAQEIDPSPEPTDSSADRPLEPSDYSQYLLYGKNEVIFVLRSLKAAGNRITMHFNEGRDSLLTGILAVDEESLTLDQGGDAATNRRAAAADKQFCVTRQDKVRVQFLLRGLTECAHEGSPAFSAALPDSVLRLQRREYYRLTAPTSQPLKCRIPVANGYAGTSSIAASIIDISGGGLAIMVPPDGIRFESGMEIADCRIDLPEVGILTTTLQIRTLFDITLTSGGQVRRAGCQFINLPGPMLTLIQRYIIKVERQRKARETGFI